MNARVQRLRAEVASDMRAFTEQMTVLERTDLANADASTYALVAVCLHHGYGAIESAISRLIRSLEGSLPEGPDWHQAVLESAALEIPSVRPALLQSDSVELLRRLLGFRHFFRHAYAVRWDPARLSQLREEALRARAMLDRDFAAIDGLLERLAAS